jgi:hypothetical protein
MYRIYKGYVESVDKVKTKDNITTYTIGKAVDTLNSTKPNRVFYNVKHGYQTEPEDADGLFRKGTLVFFVSDDSGSDGVILQAIQDNPFKTPRVLPGDDDLSNIFKSTDKPPISSGDYLWSKFDAIVMYAYTGMIKLRSKLGLEIHLDPVLDTLRVMAKKLHFRFGGFDGNVLSADLDDDTGAVSLNLGFATDTSGKDEDASLIGSKLGRLQDKTKRFLFHITDIKTKDTKTKVTINKDGDIDILGKSLVINFRDKASIIIDEEGKAYIQTEEFYLGKGTTDQPFLRGKDFKENYDTLLRLVREHRHPANGVQSFDLIGLSNLELEENRELSKTNFLD